MMLHFGANDDHIGKDQIEAVRAAHPEVEIFVYEGAGHAFNRDVDPGHYNAAAAKLAQGTDAVFSKDPYRLSYLEMIECFRVQVDCRLGPCGAILM